MDTSEQYRKMCDTHEIQERASNLIHNLYMWSPECGTCPKHKWIEVGKYCCHCGSRLKPHKMYESREGDGSPLEGEVWLPRQDQLQDMARPNWKELPYLLTTTFNGAVNGGSCSYVWDNGKHFTSMEQLWLAFVMKEKHGKTWDGDRWVVA